MEILVFFLVISNVNLVLTNDNAAVKNSVTHQDTYKVHSKPEDINLEHDQLAESSHSIGQTYEKREEVPEGSSIQVQTAAHNIQNVQQSIHLPENLRHDSVVSNVEALNPTLNQYTQAQQIYVQQYPLQPIRIFSAEALPYNQEHENDAKKILGYTSYVEHLSEKDEINSALKEGSVGDIKRLVPKSGISFKIYQNEKNVNLEDQKTETQFNILTHTYSKIPQNSRQKYRIKPEISTKIQTVYEKSHEPSVKSSIKAKEQQEKFRNFQHLLQSANADSHSQDHSQNYYLVQPEVSPIVNINSKSSSLNQPHFKLNLEENNYSKPTSATGFNSLPANIDLKHVNNLQYQKQWSFDSKTEESQKVHKAIKPVLEEQFAINPLALADRTRKLQNSQNHLVQNNFNKFNSFAESAKNNENNHQLNSFTEKASQNNFAGHLTTTDFAENKLVNRLSGNYIKNDNVKSEQNHIINLGTNAYGDSQDFKTDQNELFATNLYDSEAAKNGQNNLISHIAKNSYVEPKNSQNNFDHQKALEGSTSFDIKNAIDNIGNLNHQNYVPPTTNIHLTEDLQKPQLAYVIPKIPTSNVLVDNGVHETPIFENHQIKEFGISSAQVPYHTFSSPGINGKFFQHPSILLSSENIKQGNALTVSGLHQPLIKLYFPKEEIYQHAKTPNIELPTSSVSHISYHQPKQPYILHYDFPSVKYQQKFVFDPKSNTRVQDTQANHIKLMQPVTMDWSLFKSTFPNFNLNSLGMKPELLMTQESGKKIVPIVVRKRKNRSNNKQEVGVIYGKVNSNRRPTKPGYRHEKTIRTNLYPEVSNNVKQYEAKGKRKNEFSVSASYKVDRSLSSPNNS